MLSKQKLKTKLATQNSESIYFAFLEEKESLF